MTDYKELIRSLRNCSNNRCAPCDCGWFDKYQVDESCKEIIMWKAADAIEALQAAEPTEKQVVDYCNKRCLVVLGADLFHELKVSYGKMPKRGEWKTTDAFPHRVYCSNCYKTYVPNDRWQLWVDKPGEGGLERNYCPSCGAKMEVQE